MLVFPAYGKDKFLLLAGCGQQFLYFYRVFRGRTLLFLLWVF